MFARRETSGSDSAADLAVHAISTVEQRQPRRVDRFTQCPGRRRTCALISTWFRASALAAYGNVAELEFHGRLATDS
jgi:hypothetical protein